MVKRLAAIGCAAALLVDHSHAASNRVRAGGGQPARAGQSTPAPQRRPLNARCSTAIASAAITSGPETAGQEPARKLTLDDLDVTRVGDHADIWERVVRKMRAGMMPPAGSQAARQGRLRRIHHAGWKPSSTRTRFPTRRRPGCIV